MKRNIVQTLALTTVLASTIIGVTPTEAQAFTVNLGNGKVYDYNVETQEKKDLTESEYKAILDKQEQQSKQSQSVSSGNIRVSDTHYKTPVDGEGGVWILPYNLTDLSQIQYERNGVPYTGELKNKYHFKNGVLQYNCWFETSNGWRYLNSAGEPVTLCYVSGYYINGNGYYDSSKNDSSKGTTIPEKVDIIGVGETTLSEFSSLVSQGKIKPYTELRGTYGDTVETARRILRFSRV